MSRTPYSDMTEAERVRAWDDEVHGPWAARGWRLRGARRRPQQAFREQV